MAGPALLNWGIANSDPSFLSSQAEAVAQGARPPMTVVRYSSTIFPFVTLE